MIHPVYLTLDLD